jgi:hypothetical protein
MRTMLRTLIAATTVAAALVAPVAAATTIDTVAAWDNESVTGVLGSFSTGVFGQTFTAPSTVLNSFTFYVNDRGRPIDVFGAVYAWTGSLIAGNPAQGATGSALFTTAVFKTPGTNGLTALTINTGATPLKVGQNYVVLLAATVRNQSGVDFGVIDPNPGIKNDGGVNYFNNGFDLDLINNGNWNGDQDFGTLAWVGRFSGVVPEPESWALMLIGFGAIGIVARRRGRVGVSA